MCYNLDVQFQGQTVNIITVILRLVIFLNVSVARNRDILFCILHYDKKKCTIISQIIALGYLLVPITAVSLDGRQMQSVTLQCLSLTRTGRYATDEHVNAVCITRTPAYSCWLIRDFRVRCEDIKLQDEQNFCF